MPCLYAHYTFGEKVRAQLPQEMKECISVYEEPFHLGLQGPDFLYFYMPLRKNSVNFLGHRIHKKPGAFSIKKVFPLVRRKGRYSPETAYLIGYLCHFMLDSQCHPYVDGQAKKTGIRHVPLEGEFDKFLMKKDGICPETYPLWRHVPVDPLTIRTAIRLYPWEKPWKVAAALLSFRFCKWLLTARNPLNKRLLTRLMRFLGLYEKLQGHYLWDGVLEGSEPASFGLFIRYEGAVEETARIAKQLFEAIGQKGRVRLNPRLDVNFSGK